LFLASGAREPTAFEETPQVPVLFLLLWLQARRRAGKRVFFSRGFWLRKLLARGHKTIYLLSDSTSTTTIHNTFLTSSCLQRVDHECLVKAVRGIVKTMKVSCRPKSDDAAS
jgi:hypothetical protein